MRAKFEAFIAYEKQAKFLKLIKLYAKKYLLELPHPDEIGVRYLFVASNPEQNHRRRNQLFLLAFPFHAFGLYSCGFLVHPL